MDTPDEQIGREIAISGDNSIADGASLTERSCSW